MLPYFSPAMADDLTNLPPALIFDVKGLSNREKLSKLIVFFSELAGHGDD